MHLQPDAAVRRALPRHLQHRGQRQQCLRTRVCGRHRHLRA